MEPRIQVPRTGLGCGLSVARHRHRPPQRQLARATEAPAARTRSGATSAPEKEDGRDLLHRRGRRQPACLTSEESGPVGTRRQARERW